MLMVITKITLWRIASLAAFLIWVILRFSLKHSKLISNKYYQEFHDDELIKETETINSRNKLFFTSGETKTYIPKYILARTQYDKYVICNYAKEFKSIKYFVVEYNSKKKVTGVLEVHETYTKDASRIIPVSKSTKYINVIIKEVDNALINAKVIMPLSYKNIRKYSLLTSIKIFLLTFALRQAIYESFGFIMNFIPKTKLANVTFISNLLNGLQPINRVIYGDQYNLLLIGGLAAGCVVSYFISVIAFKKRNKRRKGGKEGVIEYEFL